MDIQLDVVMLSMLGPRDELDEHIVVCPNSRFPTRPAIGDGIERGPAGGLPQGDGEIEPGDSFKGKRFCRKQQSHEAGHDSADGSSHGVDGSCGGCYWGEGQKVDEVVW